VRTAFGLVVKKEEDFDQWGKGRSFQAEISRRHWDERQTRLWIGWNLAWLLRGVWGGRQWRSFHARVRSLDSVRNEVLLRDPKWSNDVNKVTFMPDQTAVACIEVWGRKEDSDEVIHVSTRVAMERGCRTNCVWGTVLGGQGEVEVKIHYELWTWTVGQLLCLFKLHFTEWTPFAVCQSVFQVWYNLCVKCGLVLPV
jgi:hypothetical protein